MARAQQKNHTGDTVAAVGSRKLGFDGHGHTSTDKLHDKDSENASKYEEKHDKQSKPDPASHAITTQYMTADTHPISTETNACSKDPSPPPTATDMAPAPCVTVSDAPTVEVWGHSYKKYYVTLELTSTCGHGLTWEASDYEVFVTGADSNIAYPHCCSSSSDSMSSPLFIHLYRVGFIRSYAGGSSLAEQSGKISLMDKILAIDGREVGGLIVANQLSELLDYSKSPIALEMESSHQRVLWFECPDCTVKNSMDKTAMQILKQDNLVTCSLCEKKSTWESLIDNVYADD